MFFTYCFLRDIHEGYLSLKDADYAQNNLAVELKNLVNGKKAFEKELFFK